MIAAVLACALLGGAAGAYFVTGNFGSAWGSDRACDAPRLDGSPLVAEPETTYENNGRRRLAAYAVDAASYQGGSLELCVSVGEILVEPSATGQASVEVLTSGDRADAVDATLVRVSLRADGARLIIGAWEEARGTSAGIFGEESAEVRIVVRVPDSGAYDLHARNDVGDVRASGLILGTVDARTDVGTILLRDVDLTGSVKLASDVGDAMLEATSVVSGTISVRSEVGNAEAILPSRADVGYDARAVTDVGETVIRIGDTEHYDSQGDGPGEEETARSAGFANKPTQVTVTAVTDVGDARITTQ